MLTRQELKAFLREHRDNGGQFSSKIDLRSSYEDLLNIYSEILLSETSTSNTPPESSPKMEFTYRDFGLAGVWPSHGHLFFGSGTHGARLWITPWYWVELRKGNLDNQYHIWDSLGFKEWVDLELSYTDALKEAFLAGISRSPYSLGITKEVWEGYPQGDNIDFYGLIQDLEAGRLSDYQALRRRGKAEPLSLQKICADKLLDLINKSAVSLDEVKRWFTGSHPIGSNQEHQVAGFSTNLGAAKVSVTQLDELGVYKVTRSDRITQGRDGWFGVSESPQGAVCVAHTAALDYLDTQATAGEVLAYLINTQDSIPQSIIDRALSGESVDPEDKDAALFDAFVLDPDHYPVSPLEGVGLTSETKSGGLRLRITSEIAVNIDRIDSGYRVFLSSYSGENDAGVSSHYDFLDAWDRFLDSATKVLRDATPGQQYDFAQTAKRRKDFHAKTILAGVLV